MAERSFTVRLSARVDAYVAAIKAAETTTHNFSRTTQRNMGRIGSQMQSFGRMTTIAVTLPLAAAGAAAIKAGVDWESAFTGVRKTVDGTASEMANLEKELRSMTERMPASHKEIAAVAESAGQLGVELDNISEFTEVMIKLGDTTNILGQEGAINMARFMNIMQTSHSRINELGAVIVHLGNNTETTEAEILELSTRIAGAGKIAGLSEADVMAFAAAITSVGVHAEAGGTATSKMLLMMSDAVQQGGAKLQTLADVAGVTMGEFSRQFKETPAQAFSLFISGLREIQNSGQAVTPIFAELGVADERLMRAMRDTANAGPLLAEALELASTAAADGTALNEEAAKRYETTASKIAMLRNKAVELGIDLAEILIPMLEATMKVAGGMMDVFAAVPRPIQAVIMSLLAVVAAVGPATWILGTLIRNIQTLTSVMRLLSFAQLATGLGAVLVAAGAVAAVFAVFRAKSQAAAEAVRAQEQAVKDLGVALNASSDPMAILMDEMKRFVIQNPAILAAMGQTGTTLQDLVESATEGPAAFALYADRLLGAAKASGATREELTAMRQALEGQRVLVIGAVSASEDLVSVTEDLGDESEMTTEEIELQSEAEARAQEAAEAYQEKVDALVQSLEDERDALKDTIDALNEKIDASRSAADATFALHDAEDNFLDAVEGLNEALTDGESSLRDIQQAQDDVAESAREIADVHVRLAEDQATLAGRTLTATEKLDLFNESLLAQAAAAEGPVRDAIIGYIMDLNGIPAEQATMILALIEQGKLAEAEAALGMVSRPRQSSVKLDADQKSLDETESKLDRVTRNRSLTINVGLAGSSQFVRLLDKGGMGYPGDVVAERGPELVDGELVTKPSILTRPVRVVGREDTARILERDRSEAMDKLTSSTLSPMPTSYSSTTTTTLDPQFNVRVFVGDREIKDTIRVEIENHDKEVSGSLHAGRRF